MADDEPEMPPPRRRRRVRRPWQRGALAVLALVVLCLGAGLWWIDTAAGHRFLVDRIARLRPATGLVIRIGRIDGSIYANAILRDVRLSDPRGQFLAVPVAYLDWYPVAWVHNRLDIDGLAIPYAALPRLPRLRSTGRDRPILPGFDIRLADLRIERLALGRAVAGAPRTVTVTGRADIRSGRAIVALDARSLDAGDALRVRLDSRPDDNRFDIDALAIAPGDGVLAGLSGLRRPFTARIDGDGDWRLWRGEALLLPRGGRASRVTVTKRADRYALAGTVRADLFGGLARRLAAPAVTLTAQGSMANRLIEGRARIAAPAVAIDATGGIDLARSRFDNLVVDVGVRRGSALLRDTASDGLTLRARLAGSFGAPAYEYLLTSRRVAFGKVRVTGLRAAGRGRLDPARETVLPIDIRADRVLLDEPAIDDVLQRVSIRGIARLRGGVLATAPLTLSSNKIAGRVVLLADFGRGTYTAGFTGDVRGIEIRGLGRVDLSSRIDAVSRGGGFALTGRARAAFRRFDNAFLRGLAGGLPQVTSDLVLGPDGRLAFRGLALAAPDLALSAQGYRSSDGGFHFEGGGRHDRYGPVRLVLDGKIDRPRVDLRLDRPLDALGLANVHAVLVPDAAGYAFTADGQSTLGPFAGNGAILLPRGLPAVIQVARLGVGDALASGTLRPEGGGLAGSLGVTGPARGTLAFSVANDVQQVGIDLTLARARFAGPPALYVGRGTVKGLVRLVPGATAIDGTIEARGLRYGRTRIGQFAAAARIAGDTGDVTVSLGSQAGRAFDLQIQGRMRPGAWTVRLNGTIDRAAIALSAPASFSRTEDGGWRLAPTSLRYRGGTLRVGGQFGGEGTAVDAALDRLPLALLDLADNDLGLGGLANGTVRYAASGDGPPTGQLALRLRGLTRSGLALSSAPIDIGVNGLLTADRAALRAVIASGGQVAGRAQALMTPLGQGSLVDRLVAAPLRAQVRYNGNIGTLWRLTNVELFDLAGNAAITADAVGTLADPVIRGTLATTDATLQSPVTGMSLTALAAQGSFDGAGLTLTRLDARTKGNGAVAGRGRFTFSGERGIGIDLTADLDRAAILDRDDIAATVTGPIAIRSDGSGGTISGRFRVPSSRFTLGRAGAVAAIPQLRLIESNRRGADVETEAPPSPWRLAIRATVPNRLAVTGLGMSSEWSADLDIGGTIAAPALRGNARLVRGDYDFAGRRFELREGELRFDGESPIDPALRIRANADVNAVNATITITGTSAKPIVDFTSIPALPQDELLARILFGTSITNLSAPEALQLASAVAAFQGGGGGLDPINAVRRATGLSRLRILPADAATGQKTSIAAGKNISRRVYVELITDGQGYSATRVEYQVTRWLSLISSVSTIGRQSANLRVTRDY